MVATDLDGTIVPAGGTISDRTVAVLAECERRGVDVVFVTGRPTRWLKPVAEQTRHTGLAVCANGAAVYDLHTEQVVEAHGLSADAVLDVTERLRGALPGAAFALETVDGYRREPGFMPRHEAARLAPTGTLDELVADDPVVLKILCRDETRTADALLATARDLLGGIAEPVHSDPAGHLLEVAAAGVSKATTLARLAAERGIDPGDVVAFGDMPNDVPMLRWAGRSWAMAGGHPEAIAAAGAVAPPCVEDGVARVVEELLREAGRAAQADART